MEDITRLKELAHQLRISIINTIYHAGSGHSGGSLSCVEILTVLYEKIINIRPHQPDWEDRDRFVLSKGHAAPALYTTLANKGYFAKEELKTLRQFGSCLEGHPCMFKLSGVDMSTGSLGLGISVGVGMALAAKQRQKDYRVFVLCGDGELQEGQNWEAIASANKWKLDNLLIIVDQNHVQLDGRTDEIMPMGDLKAKMDAFGMHTIVCDGHDVKAFYEAILEAESYKGTTVILAQTVKGKGVSFMEGKSAWHGKPITDEEYALAIKELTEVRA